MAKRYDIQDAENYNGIPGELAKVKRYTKKVNELLAKENKEPLDYFKVFQLGQTASYVFSKVSLTDTDKRELRKMFNAIDEALYTKDINILPPGAIYFFMAKTEIERAVEVEEQALNTELQDILERISIETKSIIYYKTFYSIVKDAEADEKAETLKALGDGAIELCDYMERHKPRVMSLYNHLYCYNVFLDIIADTYDIEELRAEQRGLLRYKLLVQEINTELLTYQKIFEDEDGDTGRIFDLLPVKQQKSIKFDNNTFKPRSKLWKPTQWNIKRALEITTDLDIEKLTTARAKFITIFERLEGAESE